jgi:mannose-6-phosphate isomerase-like protein (cupin superfamily)
LALSLIGIVVDRRPQSTQRAAPVNRARRPERQTRRPIARRPRTGVGFGPTARLPGAQPATQEDAMSDDGIRVMSREEMAARIAFFGEQTPDRNLMITQSIPGLQRDIYSIIGPGVSENAKTQPAIVDSTGFNVAYVGAAPGNASGLHSHEEVEVFIPISGTWSLFWNEGDDREQVVIGPMDCVSVPGGVMRAFRNVGSDYGYLLVIIGSTANAAVTRPKQIVDAARAAGATLNEKGKLVLAGE